MHNNYSNVFRQTKLPLIEGAGLRIIVSQGIKHQRGDQKGTMMVKDGNSELEEFSLNF